MIRAAVLLALLAFGIAFFVDPASAHARHDARHEQMATHVMAARDAGPDAVHGAAQTDATVSDAGVASAPCSSAGSCCCAATCAALLAPSPDRGTPQPRASRTLAHAGLSPPRSGRMPPVPPPEA